MHMSIACGSVSEAMWLDSLHNKPLCALMLASVFCRYLLFVDACDACDAHDAGCADTGCVTGEKTPGRKVTQA